MVVAQTSRLVGHVTRPSSLRTSMRNRRPRVNQLPLCAAPSGDSNIAIFIVTSLRSPGLRSLIWQARRDSNPQLPVLETGALPIELLAYALTTFTNFKR